MLEAVIFDFDGVLVDTPRHYYRFMKEYLQGMNEKITDEDVRHLVGRTFDKKLAYLDKKFSLRLDKDDFVEKTYTRMMGEFGKNFEPNNCLTRLLRELSDEKIKIAIASNNGRKNIDYFLKLLGCSDFFGVIVSSQDSVQPKPSPESYLLAAKMLSCSPENCVGIEDSKVGLKAVKKAGMKAIGIRNEFVPEKDMVIADLVVDSVCALDCAKIRAVFE